MTWFKDIFGVEECPERIRKDFFFDSGQADILHTESGRRWKCGQLSIPSLTSIRHALSKIESISGGRKTSVNTSIEIGDITKLMATPRMNGAFIQMASQCNLLEMPSPHTTPEAGISGYEFDRTQGPAVAMATAASTLQRAYFVPNKLSENKQDSGGVDSGDTDWQQTSNRQLDLLTGVSRLLMESGVQTTEALWKMQNGYVMPNGRRLLKVDEWLGDAGNPQRGESLRRSFRIGLHRHCDVTIKNSAATNRVHLLLCSALPLSYWDAELRREVLAGGENSLGALALQAQYEACLLATLCLPLSTEGPRKVLLTKVGGGAFGNPSPWIENAIRRAIQVVRNTSTGRSLDVRLVCAGGATAIDREIMGA